MAETPPNDTRASHDELAALFPGAARLVIADDTMWSGFERLFAEEQALGVRAVQKRKRELAAGRHAARAALAQLGYDAAPIERGAAGAPRWPAGACGSITHCKGFAAAVVAHTNEVLSVGFDAEGADALKANLVDMICAADERAQIDALPAAPVGTDWPKLAFSCKEAFYKAYYPLGGVVLDFRQVRITFDAARAAFRVALIDAATPSAAGWRVFDGRFSCDGERIYSGVAIITPR